MIFPELSPREQAAIARMLGYWAEHWDADCPTLFGIGRDELQAVLDAWPRVAIGGEPAAALALVGAMRELMFGAMAVRAAQFPAIAGISFGEAGRMLERLRPWINAALAHA